ncbi:MAG: 2-amino-4-hydroxy-6-hydroxymethyldihydropteridine diphosphokinase [Flavobacteriales bacterium]|jgi:2-amino-4-hydroxy-6-hydroxymethyldihydropteridine diphosphokinase
MCQQKPKHYTAYIGLGSNLNAPKEQILQAQESVNSLDSTLTLRLSKLYQSRAVGPGEQQDYINAVIKITTSLTADALLTALQRIENQHGRVRIERWGARTLDLDLLWYNNETISTSRLTVPHPRILERNFVLFPLADLAPDLSIDGKHSISQAAEIIGWPGLQRLN